MRTALDAVATAGLRRPWAALLAGLVVAAGCAALALGLSSSASPSLLSDPDSGPGAATPAQERAFGGEPIAVVIEGNLFSETLRPDNLNRLAVMENKMERLDGVRAVAGPGTIVDESAAQIFRTIKQEIGPLAPVADRAAEAERARARNSGASAADADRRAEAARLEALGPKLEDYQDLIARLGTIGLPSAENRDFVLNLVFGPDQQPKERFQWVFGDAEHAVVVVRPEPGLGDAQLRRLGDRLQALADKSGTQDLRLQVAGAPLVVAGIADEFPKELLRLAPVLLLVMVLALLFGLRRGRGRLRLLVLAAGAVLGTAAASRVLGLGLTPATVAALPVVLGLAVDYGVQLQARYWSERTAGREPPDAARTALLAVGPTLALAGAAMTVGFLALTVSSVPLIDRLGLTLAAGTVVSVAVVLLFGAPLLATRDRRAGAPPVLGTERLGRPGVRTRRVLVAGTLLAVLGIALAGGTRVQSDLAQLAPDGLAELEAATAVQRELGTAGTLRLAITAPDVTRADVVEWQADLQDRILALDTKLDLGGPLRPGPDLGDLLSQNGSAPTDQAAIAAILRLIPKPFLDAVITKDRTRAEMSFSVPLVDVHRQAELLERIEQFASTPPEGVRLEPAGLLALGAASVTDLEDGRLLLLVLGALGVFLTLLAFGRRPERAVLPLAPALLAAGVAALLVRLSGIELSPLGAGLEPLVLAVGVEFGVLLLARYEQARAAGEDVDAARRTAVGLVGGAVAVSAATVGLGFAALAASRFELLQQFGVLVALEVALCGVLAVWLVPMLAAEQDRRAQQRVAEGREPWRWRELPRLLGRLPRITRWRELPRLLGRLPRITVKGSVAAVRDLPAGLRSARGGVRNAPRRLAAALRGVPVVLSDVAGVIRSAGRARRLNR